MSDQTACPFEKLQVFVVEGIQLIALRIEHPENVPVVVAHRHNDLGTSGMKRRQIPEILAHVAYDDGLPDSRAAPHNPWLVGKRGYVAGSSPLSAIITNSSLMIL